MTAKSRDDNHDTPSPVPPDLVRFLDTLFDPADWILIRPIETWTENGKKKSRPVYTDFRWLKPGNIQLPMLWALLTSKAEREHANLFFGVCPRFRGRQYDLAWQIRTVRALWCDIDHCQADEALKRCDAAGLPRPSIIVRSGHGVHLYWLLQEPYLLDDCGEPPAVYRRLQKGKKPVLWIKGPDGEPIYQEDFPKVSDRGLVVQNTIAGIAAQIGGDHTQDLARLLRLPCTLNRKDERNGAQPVPCELVECESTRRYAFSDFTSFVAKPQVRPEVQQIRLPQNVKMTPSRLNKLNDLINRCQLAEDRSKADFSLCCKCVEYGWDKEQVWSQVQGISKFADPAHSRKYFDLTWDKARSHTQQKIYDRACRKAGVQNVNGQPAPALNGHNGDNGVGYLPPATRGAKDRPLMFMNFYLDTEGEDGENPVRKGNPIQDIHKVLEKLTDQWPRRVGNALFAEGADHKPVWLERPPALFAWIAKYLPGGRDNLLQWAEGPGLISRAEFHAYLVQQVQKYEGVEPYPHWPVLAGHYYMHPEPKGGDSSALDELVARFNPATPVDNDLIFAFFLSLLWGAQPGQRPAWLFTNDDDDDDTGRGVGKSTLAKMASRLVGGFIRVTPEEDMDKLMPRLLSPEALERRVALLDNVKKLRFSWSDLESLITSDVISGRQLYVGEGRRSNTLTWAITLNGANLSSDLAQRCVIVKIARPQYSATWEDETIALIEGKRWEIIGDILAELKAPVEPLKRHSRWGAWEDAVLAHVAEPAECQKVIEERQEAVDDDREEANEVRNHIIGALKDRGHEAERDVIWIPSAEMAQIVNDATGKDMHVRAASAFLANLKVSGIRKSDRNGNRGWEWRGRDAVPGTSAKEIWPKGEAMSACYR